jgi:hypothetical protein
LAKLGLIIVLIRLLEKNQASDFEDGVILDRYNTGGETNCPTSKV